MTTKTKETPQGEEFANVPCPVPEHVFDDFMPIIIHRIPIDVNGRRAVVRRCSVKGGQEPQTGLIPCLLTGQYMEPIAGTTTA